MTTYTFDENIVSDLHKDAYGRRPSFGWWDSWNDSSDAYKQRVWDGLLKDLEETIERERLAHKEAIAAMHQRIQDAMLLGAADKVQALKWIMEAEEFEDYDLLYGSSYFCFHFGLPYSADQEFPIQQAINEMLSEVVHVD